MALSLNVARQRARWAVRERAARARQRKIRAEDEAARDAREPDDSNEPLNIFDPEVYPD